MELTKAQDDWLEAVEKFGNNLRVPEVAQARKRLDSARLSYLALVSENKTGSDARRTETGS
jgi:hypothetical protein